MVVPSFYERAQVKVMNDMIDLSRKQYAVIEGGHEGRREPFVLAYREEKSLRDLIAAPSIIALGFASREQAVANIERCLAALDSRTGVQTATTENTPEQSILRCHPAKSASASPPRRGHCLSHFKRQRISGTPRVYGHLIFLRQVVPMSSSRFHSHWKLRASRTRD